MLILTKAINMMKQVVLTLAFLMALAFTSHAQLFNIGGFGVGYLYIGPKAGGNASFNSVDVGSGVDKTANFGYQFGGVAKFGVTQKLSIQPEMVYQSKGFGTKTSFATTKSNYKYIGLPVIAKYAFLMISGVQIYGSGGFYTDVLTGVSTKIEFVDGGGETYSETTLDPFTKAEFGLNFGGGANIPFKSGDKLNVDLRLTYGINKFENSSTNTEGRNISVQLSAIYLVDLTKWVSFKGKSIENKDTNEDSPAGGRKVER